jgi:hypothetical protein
VRRDGTVVGPALFGSPIPVDPGEHTVEASAPGKTPWKGNVTVGATGAAESIAIPALVDAGVPVVTPSAAPPPAPLAETPGDRAMSHSAQPVLGWTAVGAGVVGLVIGGIFVGQRSSKLSTRNAICASGDPNQCPPGSQARVNDLTDQARSANTVATVGFVAGGVLAAGGLVLILTSPKHPSSEIAISPMLSPQFQGLMVTSHGF